MNSKRLVIGRQVITKHRITQVPELEKIADGSFTDDSTRVLSPKRVIQFSRISNASGITGTTDDFIRKKSDYYGSSQVTKTEHQSNTLCEALKLRREIKSQIEDEKIQTNGEHTMT